ncbi:MAG: hypothetical protein ACTHMW_10635 [Actinomycetes bacterium]
MHRRLELPDDGLPMDEETADRMWRPWTPQQVRDELRDCPAEWMVAGGWALDLFLEQAGAADASRAHEDLEIAVPAQQFSLVRNRLAPGRQWVVPVESRVRALDETTAQDAHQTWLWDEATAAFVLDVFREPGLADGDGPVSPDETTWVCRRDDRLRLPMSQVRRWSADGIPYTAPEVVLLFKAKHRRPKDELDLARTVPALDDAARGWLRDALTLVHPARGPHETGHPWLRRF